MLHEPVVRLRSRAALLEHFEGLLHIEPHGVTEVGHDHGRTARAAGVALNQDLALTIDGLIDKLQGVLQKV